MLRRIWSDALLHYVREVEHPGKDEVWSRLQKWNLNRRLWVRVPPGGGLWVSGGDRMQDTLLRTGEFEPEACRWLDQNTRNSDVFWDIGARIGFHAVRLATRFPLRELHCFEARSGCHPLLRTNLQQLSPPAYVHPFLPVPELAQSPTSGAALAVEAVCRKRLAAPPDVMRVHAPGQEIDLLQGALPLWQGGVSPRGVLLVVRPDPVGGIADKALRKWLEENGWEWRRLKENLNELGEEEVFLAHYARGTRNLP